MELRRRINGFGLAKNFRKRKKRKAEMTLGSAGLAARATGGTRDNSGDMRGLLRSGTCWAGLACGLMPAAETKWVQGHLGTMEIYSDGSNRAAFEKLGVFEEFRFALGTVVGKPDLQTDPPIRLIVSKAFSLTGSLTRGRDRIIIPLAPDAPIPASVFREATKVLLEKNVARLPDEIERGLVDFFSTIEVRGVHVSWGAPPPANERTRDWARIQLIATKPEYYGKLKVLMFNLLNGVADAPAYRNSIGKTKAEFETELDAYFRAGMFTACEGPNKPLNVQRDLVVKPLDAGDVELAMADLLNADSRATYEKMLKNRKYSTEACEGLALLAIAEKDAPSAKMYLQKATDAQSRNGAIWLAYALQEDDRVKSNEALDQALALDSNLAEAHYEKGVRRHLPAQLKTATTLEPRMAKYWDALAQVYLDDNQFPEAGRAWRSAERAAIDPAEKEKMHQSWQVIEKEKLDYGDSEKKRVADEKERDLQKLKDKALAELHASEAKINKSLGETGTANPAVPVVPWDEAQPITVTGVLKQVDCLGKQTRVTIEGGDDRQVVVKLLVRDRKGLACGAQKARPVTVEYYPKPDARLGTSGEVAAIPQ
jgi:hypothetical protein